MQICEDSSFLGGEWPIFPNKDCFRKPVSKPCSFHSCQSTFKNQRHAYQCIDEVLMINKSKNTEISLTEGHFWQ